MELRHHDRPHAALLPVGRHPRHDYIKGVTEKVSRAAAWLAAPGDARARGQADGAVYGDASDYDGSVLCFGARAPVRYLLAANFLEPKIENNSIFCII